MEKFKILVVDDEQDFLETIIKRLKTRGIEVAGVDSGYKALEFVDNQDVDVIILDVKMPGMDGGLDFLAQLEDFQFPGDVSHHPAQALVDLDGLQQLLFFFLGDVQAAGTDVGQHPGIA